MRKRRWYGSFLESRAYKFWPFHFQLSSASFLLKTKCSAFTQRSATVFSALFSIEVRFLSSITPLHLLVTDKFGFRISFGEIQMKDEISWSLPQVCRRWSNFFVDALTLNQTYPFAHSGYSVYHKSILSGVLLRSADQPISVFVSPYAAKPDKVVKWHSAI